MFTGKNEFQASVSTTLALGSYHGLRSDVQTAYSITNHLGVLANSAFSSSKDGWNQFTNQAGEVGLGYFTNAAEKWCFEVYSGVGFGAAHGVKPFELTGSGFLYSSTDAKYQKFFLQPSIGVNKGSKLWNFSLKISKVHLNSRFTEPGGATSASGQSAVFFEPMAQWQAPLKKKRFFFTFSAGLNLQAGEESTIDYDPLTISGGLLMKLGMNK